MADQSIFDTPDETEMGHIQAVRDYIEAGNNPGPDALKRMEFLAKKYDLDLDTILSRKLGREALGGGLTRGATMGWSDELRGAGAAIMPGGDDYTGGRDLSRRRARTQELLKPKTAFGSEIGGAFAPAVAGIALTRGRGGPVGQITNAGRNLGSAIGIGAAEGAATAYGEQEGSNIPDPLNTAVGAGAGAAGGLFGSLLARIGDNARVKTAVTQEVERLMKAHGLNGDEVVEQLARGGGPVTTNNQTLLAEVRALYNMSSDAAKKEAWERTGQMAGAGRQRVAEAVTPEGVDTAAPAYRGAQTVADTDARYADAFAADAGNLAQRGGVPDEVTKMVENMANVRPGIVDDVNAGARAAYLEQGGDITQWRDIVAMGPDGRVAWSRQPTPEELARINMTMREAATKGFREMTPGASSLSNMQKGFRERLGQEDIMPAWGGQQAAVAAERSAKEAYDLAAKVGSSPQKAQEAAAAFQKMTPGEQEAFRAGLAEAVKQRMGQATGPTSSPLRSFIPNEDAVPSELSMLVRMVFGDEAVDLMRGGQGWQDAANALRGGSWTSELLQRQGQRRSGGASDLSVPMAIDAATGGGGAATATAAAAKGARALFTKVIGLRDEKVMDQLLNVLTTNDPGVLEAALKGDEGAIRHIAQLARDMVSGLGAATGAVGGSDLMQGGEPDPLPMLDASQ